MPRNPILRGEVSWEDRYGTTSSGNLPRYDLHECIENTVDLAAVQTVFPWVTIDDFHYDHLKCPFTSEGSPEEIFHWIRSCVWTNTAPSIAADWDFIEVVPAARTAHTTTSGIMIRHDRGARRYGWLCVDPACRYYLTHKTPYFYI
jgi:hypothetical protein